MSPESNLTIPDRMRPGVFAALVLMLLLAISVSYFGALRLFEAQATSVARSQHALYLRSLNETLKQHQHLPFVLGENPSFARNLSEDRAETLNAPLAEFAEAAGLEAIYIMSLSGQVVAASNHAAPNSFLGQNYGFRPYFQRAAAGARSDYFAIGATTGRPGYFVAEPLRAATGTVVGVVAIKLDISELQASWEERGEAVLATNADGIVVLASNPAWLYRSIAPLRESRRVEIASSRQFGNRGIAALSWQADGTGAAALEGQRYFVTSGPTEVVDWTVHYLTPEASVQRQTLQATGVLGFFLSGLIGFSVFLRSRRIQAALDVSQRQRQELTQINARLVAAQEELSRSSKLAALGQLAASVTHELGQPISAFKNHLFAAEIGGEITSPETLTNLRRLADRMEGITKQLRFFARTGQDAQSHVEMAVVVREALGLLQHDLDAAGVDVDWSAPDAACTVLGNQLQLEQAMVNLLRNAFYASRGTERAAISIQFEARGAQLDLYVSDSGAGLEGRSVASLLEPFYSTRSSGDGMGLGLAITAEILRAHGGHLTAHDGEAGGAVFVVTLPLSEEPI